MSECSHIARVSLQVVLCGPGPRIECVLCEIQRLEKELEAATSFEFSGPGGTWWAKPLNTYGIWTIGMPGWVGGERFSREGAIAEAKKLAAQDSATKGFDV